MKEFLRKLGITQSGHYSSNNNYVIDLDDSKDYDKICSILDKSDLVEEHKDNSQDDIALTWEDLDVPMPYGGKIPDELKHTYAVLAQDYFKQHPEYLNKDKNGNDED